MKLNASELAGVVHKAVSALCAGVNCPTPALMASGKDAAHFTLHNEDGSQLQVTVTQVEAQYVRGDDKVDSTGAELPSFFRAE